jgi:hypothetical protein
MSRGGSKINRADGDYERSSSMPKWLTNFADSLNKQKSAVQVARDRDHEAGQYSILNQISNLVSDKPRHATVDSIVKEMRERTGLDDYLKRISAKADIKKNLKVEANKEESVLPKSLSKYKKCSDDIINYIRNTISNTHGMGVTIPQLQHDILYTFGKRYGLETQDVLNDDVAKYINDCIVSAQSHIVPEEHNPNIGAGVGRTEGETDEDKDAFAILMPATE